MNSRRAGLVAMAGVLLWVGSRFFTLCLGYYRLVTRGQVSQGIVVGKHKVGTRAHTFGSESIDYRFLASDGEAFEGNESRAIFRHAVRVGQPVRVVYLPEDPQVSALAGDELLDLLEASSYTAVFWGFAAYTLILVCVRVRRESLLLREGVEVEGKVVSVRPIGRGRYFWKVRYTYKDLAGHVHTGQSDPTAGPSGPRERIGSTGKVLYDPKDSKKSLWLGTGGRPS